MIKIPIQPADDVSAAPWLETELEHLRRFRWYNLADFLRVIRWLYIRPFVFQQVLQLAWTRSRQQEDPVKPFREFLRPLRLGAVLYFFMLVMLLVVGWQFIPSVFVSKRSFSYVISGLWGAVFTLAFDLYWNLLVTSRRRPLSSLDVSLLRLLMTELATLLMTLLMWSYVMILLTAYSMTRIIGIPQMMLSNGGLYIVISFAFVSAIILRRRVVYRSLQIPLLSRTVALWLIVVTPVVYVLTAVIAGSCLSLLIPRVHQALSGRHVDLGALSVPVYITFVVGLALIVTDAFPSMALWLWKLQQRKWSEFVPGILGEDLGFLPEPKLDEKLLDYVKRRLANYPEILQWVFRNSMQHWAISRLLKRIRDEDFIWLIERLLASPQWNVPDYPVPDADAAEQATLLASPQWNVPDYPRNASPSFTWLELFLESFVNPEKTPWYIAVLQPLARLSISPLSDPQYRLFRVLLRELHMSMPHGSRSQSPLDLSKDMKEAAHSLMQLETGWAAGFSESLQRLAVLTSVENREGFMSFQPAPASVDLASEWLEESRRNILLALGRAEEVALDVRNGLQMTSRLARQSALALVTEKLQRLHSEKLAPMPIAEYKILRSTLNRWARLLVEISAEEARFTPPLVENPYIVGDPVTGNRFFDREMILGKLSNRIRTGQSVLLVGHRRSGKTSILMQLASEVTEEWLPIYITLERLVIVADDSHTLLYNSLQSIKVVVQESGFAAPELAPREQFMGDVVQWTDVFLKKALAAIYPRRIVLCLDEYELLEEAVEEGGRYSRAEMEYLIRGCGHGLVIIASGRAGPRELRQRFRRPIFERLPPEWVDMLGEVDAEKLITNPVTDFQVNYESQAVDRIIFLTSGQPYLIQLICQMLIDKLLEKLGRDPRHKLIITKSDLEAVLTPELFEKGSFYFSQVWGEAGKAGQRVLQALATSNGAKSKSELLELVGDTTVEGDALVKELTAQSIITDDDSLGNSYSFTIPLMRDWVKTETATLS